MPCHVPLVVFSVIGALTSWQEPAMFRFRLWSRWGKLITPGAIYMTEDNRLLEVKNLKVQFPIRRGIFQRTVGWTRAVDGISFSIRDGETLGLVGESGCGKTCSGSSASPGK